MEDRIIKKGTVCRVIEDSDDFFKPGDIVVTLEDDSCAPYCCLKKYYTPRYSVKDYYPNNLVSPLLIKELEELYDWEEKSSELEKLYDRSEK